MPQDFMTIHDLTPYEFSHIMDLAREVKEKPLRFKDRLKHKILALIFEKPSLRTRVAFQAGVLQLGGHAVYLSSSDIGMGSRESLEDVAKNIERWVDGVVIRAFAHETAVKLAGAARIPVINGLTDLHHPCQAMADFFTLKEKRGALSDLKLAYVGDGNNVCHSLLLAAAKTGSKVSVATPPGYEPEKEILETALRDGEDTGFSCEITHDPIQAVREADAVYTDVWVSMGQESEREKRTRIFAPYQVNPELMAQAGSGALFMHCLPARRGEEVTDEVIDSPISVVYEQAENRLHVQKAIMLLLVSEQAKKWTKQTN